MCDETYQAFDKIEPCINQLKNLNTVKPPFTKEEKECLDLLAKAWNAWLQLPEQHSSDRADFLMHVNALQNILMARVCARDYPDYFNVKTK